MTPSPVGWPISVYSRRIGQAKGGLAEERFGDLVPAGRHRFELRRGVGERNVHDVVAVQGGHAAEALLMDEIRRLEPVARGEDAVAGGGRSAPLYMNQNRDAGLVASALLDFLRERLADPAQAD